MKQNFIQTDTFVLKKHNNLRIYRVLQQNGAAVLWLSEQQAAQHVQRLHMEKLLVARRYK
jgi:hypothetical protein